MKTGAPGSILAAFFCSLLAFVLSGSVHLEAQETGDEASAAKKEAARGEAVQKGLRDVKASLVAGDAAALDKACARLARVGGARAIDGLLSLLGKIPPAEDGLYWSLAGGIVSFGDEDALECLGDFLQKHARNAVTRDLLIALARNPSPHVAAAMESLARSGSPEVKLLVAERIGRIRSPRSVDALIEILKDEEKKKPDRPTELMRRAVHGLEFITGESFGPSSVNWEGWWKRNRNGRLGGEGAAARRHTGTAVDFLDADRDAVFVGLEKAPPQRVVVLSAKFTKAFRWDFNKDQIETVLDSMKVPHTVVRREDFLDFDLATTSAIVINCTQYLELCLCPKCKQGGKVAGKRAFQCVGCNEHHMHSARLDDAAIEKLRDFVLRGGYLFCEDWNVKEIIPRLFPDFVGPGEQLKPTSVDVMPMRGAGSHPYLRGVFEPARSAHHGFGDDTILLSDDDDDDLDKDEGDRDRDRVTSGTTVVFGEGGEGGGGVNLKHEWQIDDESYALHVIDRRRVVTLLRSDRLRKATDGDGAVAVAFRPGKGSRGAVPPGASPPAGGAPGVVTVILSHFGHQNTQVDEFALQNILLNFLLDAHVQQQKIPGWAERLAKEKAEIDRQKREAGKKKRQRKRPPE